MPQRHYELLIVAQKVIKAVINYRDYRTALTKIIYFGFDYGIQDVYEFCNNTYNIQHRHALTCNHGVSFSSTWFGNNKNATDIFVTKRLIGVVIIIGNLKNVLHKEIQAKSHVLDYKRHPIVQKQQHPVIAKCIQLVNSQKAVVIPIDDFRRCRKL
ncbi:hypothetical protein BDF20DRAFT_837973 [Mycotypha africana]|uniref:uncharacterized protein n=1 Tax=Mycotypha africana TaxID=64632 RepID=UPI002301490C|nr:uncharacterized protein BDF20DRAFT_837973 [Mycotypha africana]KAI8971674.1 hypothetical protein BDF20DRAFT_837973 [Mycotypha africana]